MMCKFCNKEHDGSYGNGLFCSKSCCSAYNLSLGRNKGNNKRKGRGDWKCNFCEKTFESRRELQNHRKENHSISSSNKYAHLQPLSKNPYCLYCGEYHKYQYAMNRHIRFCKLNPNRDWEESKKLSKIQKEAQSKAENRENKSKFAKENNYKNHYRKKCITYETKEHELIKLDSELELIVAKKLDSMNVTWFRPSTKLQYIDNEGKIRNYIADFYVKEFNCLIEVKSPYIAQLQNKNGRLDYLKSHYDFIIWIENLNSCYNFKLENKNCPYKIEKKIYKNEEKRESKSKQLESERWNIIQNSNIDFSKFGWVNEISKLFGIVNNKGGNYIKKHFPQFYKTCYKRK